jgi:zinc transporter 1/2/3
MLRLGLLFGAGIILSTAFIHMFVPAVLLLTDPCLSAAFTEDYEAFAGM